MGAHEGETTEGQPEPNFEDFETRAMRIGHAGLEEAVWRSSFPDSIFMHVEVGNLLTSLAIPYARLLAGDRVDQRAATASYNALYFATAVGSKLIGRQTLPRYPLYFVDEGSDATRRQKILEDKTTYLAKKPQLRGWITEYIGQIDPSGAFQDIAEAVTAVTLKDIETAERHQQASINAELLLRGEDQ